MNAFPLRLFRARPSALDEYPWLTPCPRKRRKARLRIYGRAALVLGALAVPQVAAIAFRAPDAQVPRPLAALPERAIPKLIDAPFSPKSLRDLSSADAEAWNAKIPAQALAIQTARPFSAGGAGTTFSRSLQCLTAAVYYEAAQEPLDGQRAVAQVVLNRVRHPEYPHSVCGVVYQGSERRTGCQFSFTCDGSLARVPSAAGWARAEGVAAAALAGQVYAPVGWATHYHADYVVPYWAASLQKLSTIGRHIFYRWAGAAGDAASFTSKYAALEPDVSGNALTPAPETALEPLPGEITRVSDAERPIIAAGSKADAEPKAEARSPAASPAPANERWIIAQPR